MTASWQTQPHHPCPHKYVLYTVDGRIFIQNNANLVFFPPAEKIELPSHLVKNRPYRTAPLPLQIQSLCLPGSGFPFMLHSCCSCPSQSPPSVMHCWEGEELRNKAYAKASDSRRGHLAPGPFLLRPGVWPPWSEQLSPPLHFFLVPEGDGADCNRQHCEPSVP